MAKRHRRAQPNEATNRVARRGPRSRHARRPGGCPPRPRKRPQRRWRTWRSQRPESCRRCVTAAIMTARSGLISSYPTGGSQPALGSARAARHRPAGPAGPHRRKAGPMSRATSVTQDGQQRRHDYRPRGTVKGTSLFATLRRTVTEFSEDNLTDWAAALTYYGLLAMFPALIALVSIVGLVGDPTSTTQHDHRRSSPRSAPARPRRHSRVRSSRSPATSSAAGRRCLRRPRASRCGRPRATSARSCAPSNVIYETPEGRPFWKLRPLQLLVTLVMIVLLALVALALVSPARSSTRSPSRSASARPPSTVWDIAKWPVLLRGRDHDVRGAVLRRAQRQAAGVQMGDARRAVRRGRLARRVGRVRVLRGQLRLLRQDLRHPRRRRRRCSCGCGSPTLALLLGMELNAERERSRELEAGVPGAERELQLDARSAPKRQKTT